MLDKKDLVEGKFYYQDWEGGYYIMKALKTGGWQCSAHINVDKEGLASYRTSGDFSYVKIAREATLEEQAWLEACITAERLVEKPEIVHYQIF